MNASTEELGNNPSESINQTSESANLDQATPDENALEESESGAVSEEEEVHAESEKEQKDPWYKRRIDELTKDKHEARRHAERLERMLEQISTQQRAPEPVAPSIQPPNPEDFAGGQYDPRYIQAQLEYTRVSAIEEAKRAVAAEYEQRAQAGVLHGAAVGLQLLLRRIGDDGGGGLAEPDGAVRDEGHLPGLVDLGEGQPLAVHGRQHFLPQQ